MIEWLADIAKLATFMAFAYLMLQSYSRFGTSDWAAYLTRRRVTVLGLLVLAITAVKIGEDAMVQESGPVDTTLLRFVHEHVPAAFSGFFTVVTLSGSALFLVPATVMVVVALLMAKRRFEATLMGTSMIAALLLVYGLKTIVGRARPALWETQWYWGSSFPSGHTLGTAAFATASALCLARIWPRGANLAFGAALLWTGLVALSRLVLGVHWPSDVLAALCLGVFIPLLLRLVCGAGAPGSCVR